MCSSDLMGARGRERATAEFSVEGFVAESLRVYDDLLPQASLQAA